RAGQRRRAAARSPREAAARDAAAPLAGADRAAFPVQHPFQRATSLPERCRRRAHHARAADALPARGAAEDARPRRFPRRRDRARRGFPGRAEDPHGRAARERDRRAGGAVRGSRSFDDARDPRRERDQAWHRAARGRWRDQPRRRPRRRNARAFGHRYRAGIRRGFRLGRRAGQHPGAARRAIWGAGNAPARSQLAARNRRHDQAAVDLRRPATMSYGWFTGFGKRHLAIVLTFCAVVPLTHGLFTLAVDPASHHGAVVGEAIACFVIGMAAMLSVIATENRLAGVLGPAPRMAIAIIAAAIAGTLLMQALTQFVIRPLALPIEEMDTAMYSGDAHRIAYRFASAATWALMLIALYAMFEAKRRATEELHAVRVVALSAERSLVEGNLRAMQARVDPDLLFDALL